ncbi:glycoside hydrolase family 32 protein [Micropruina sp.]|uniref:glycoside hydrolase family 32 protein n=1 Tax=Micropruina sp. TaxID=2737536 RepID=UPI0039E53284
MPFDPSFRPLAHFTPRRNWMNDPNGMLFHEGEYHLFFQHNTTGLVAGNPSWGHAVSTNLVDWVELPVAIPSTANEWVLSGSAVVDERNVSGFGTTTGTPMVALYTSHDPVSKVQSQSVAFSRDRGRTWQKYAGNPVLDIGSTEFRDPKILRDGDEFVMVLVMAEDRAVRLYRSADLLDWRLSSEMGGFGFTAGVWECPDIVRVPIEGTDETAWVLLLSVQAGGPVGGSGMQYAVVAYDGKSFRPLDDARWLDLGSDFYAAISYTGTDEPEPVIQGWMNNWAYAADVPADGFRGSMTLPRRLSLRERPSGLRLVQQVVVADAPPVHEAEHLRIDGRWRVPVDVLAARVSLELEFGSATRAGMDVRVGDDGERTRIVVDRDARTISLDRTSSGESGFHEGFAAVHTAPLPVADPQDEAAMGAEVVRLDVFIDVSSVELLAADGEVALTDLVFPSPESRGIEVFAEGGEAVVRSLVVAPL